MHGEGIQYAYGFWSLVVINVALFAFFIGRSEPHREMKMGLLQATILKYYGNRGIYALGALMGLAFGAQIFISVYEMWLKKVQEKEEA